MQYLKSIRNTQGITQEQAAQAVGVHVQSWKGYEAGAYAPSWEVLKAMRAKLGIDLNALAESEPVEIEA